MDLFKFIIISLHITKVFSRNSRKKYGLSSSDESIENLLYYQDCQHRRNEPSTTTPKPTPEPVRPNPCPNPRMCCSLSCENQCGGNMVVARQDGSSMAMQPIMPYQQVQPRPMRMPPQPSMMNRARGLKRNQMPPVNLIAPEGTRRDFGFTKEKIKSLITKDVEIRKILKELVRVTMQKVDLVDKLKTRRTGDTNWNTSDNGNDIGYGTGDDAVEHSKDIDHHEEDYADDDDDDDLE